MPLIEKAITDANMGFTPGNNGNSVLVPVPPLSEERRVELNKFVHKLVEDGRVAVEMSDVMVFRVCKIMKKKVMFPRI